MTAKIEPWIECAVWEIDSWCLETGAFFNRAQAAAIIAAHAPKQEPLSKSVHKRLIAQGAIDPSVPLAVIHEIVATLKGWKPRKDASAFEFGIEQGRYAAAIEIENAIRSDEGREAMTHKLKGNYIFNSREIE